MEFLSAFDTHVNVLEVDTSSLEFKALVDKFTHLTLEIEDELDQALTKYLAPQVKVV